MPHSRGGRLGKRTSKVNSREAILEEEQAYQQEDGKLS